MRIGIDARFYGSLGKGLGRYTEKLIEHLERIDTENEYVIFLRQENFDDYHPKNSHFKKVLAHYTWYSLAEQIFFPWRLYREDLNLVHFPHFNVPIFYRRPFVMTLHDLILLRYPTVRNSTRGALIYMLKFLAYRFVIATAIRRAKRIITVSRFTQKDIQEHYPEAAEKIVVTYEAADPYCQYFSEEQAKRTLERLCVLRAGDQGLVLHDIIRPYLLYVGNAYPHKNLEFLLSVAEKMPEQLFVLVGKEDYFYARLKQTTKQRGLQNVIFTGYLDDRELSILYRYATLYVFPSLYEGFGLPPLEAMARGLPVLASERGSLPEILGEAAVYFDPEDSASLQGRISQILVQPEKREEMRRLGYRQVARYSFETMARETQKSYVDSLKTIQKS